MSDFLKLMAAQFQNQNLDSNTDNTEYITELAQFSSVQAMTSLTQNFNKQYAASLIGKTVTVTDTSSSGVTSVHSGTVQGANFDSSGNCRVVVGGNSYDLSDVTQASSDSAETVLAIREYASSLIGYTVTVSTGDTANPTVTGIVQNAVYGTDGSCKITIDGNTYNPADVTQVEFGTAKT